MVSIQLDCNERLGRIKPLHGINNAPLSGTDNQMFHYLGEAGVPYSRLHDTGRRFGGGCFVDIENVFRSSYNRFTVFLVRTPYEKLVILYRIWDNKRNRQRAPYRSLRYSLVRKNGASVLTVRCE